MRIPTRAFSLALTLAALSSGAALAHSWYPHECCSNRDCQPVFDAVRVDGGWQSGGRFYSDSITRVSQDGDFHSCYSPVREICFFVPLSS